MYAEMKKTVSYFRQTGATLIELVAAIVVIAVGVGGLMLAITATGRHSADPMITEQAIGIAQTYMEEIMLQAYTDPGGPVELGRADFDDVDDYNGLNDVGARDQLGNPIAGLGAYTIVVTVAAPALLNGELAKQIDVSIDHAAFAGIPLTLTSFRTNYP